jgi:capsular polysaccharide transport system permease protein
MSSEPLEVAGAIESPDMTKHSPMLEAAIATSATQLFFRGTRAAGASVARIVRDRALFVVVVIVPTVLAIVYFGLIAPDVYVSESHFVVRDQQHQTVGAIGNLLQGAGLSQGRDESYSVQDFLSSRDALSLLETRFHLSQSYGLRDIDSLSRFPGPSGDASFESLLRYYRKHIVTSDFDTTSSIMTLTVRAFTAVDARRIDAALLELSEDFVNKLNQRARADLIQFAEADAKDAESEAKSAVQAVSNNRNASAVFDPDKQSALQLAQIGKLQEELIETRNRIADVHAVAVDNPQIPVLQSRTRVLQAAIDAETAKVVGGLQSLSTKSVAYEDVVLERSYADRRLEIALSALQEAHANASKQQLYIERLAEPSMPDEAIEPKRLRNMAAAFMLSLIVWGVLSLFTASVKEHAE